MRMPRNQEARGAQRTPIGQRNVLTAPKKAGYVRRFVNIDDNGRIDMFKDAGWKIVEECTSIGDANVGSASQLGTVASKPVGGGRKAVLMEIREDWYKEDQAAKDARLKENERGLLKDQNGQVPNQSNLYGEGISIQSNRPVVQST